MRRRRMISDTVRSEIWDRWKRGETLHDIGRVFDSSHTTIFAVLAPTGYGVNRCESGYGL